MSSRYPEPFWLKWIPGGRFTFRFLTGRPLDGIRRTDAVFHRRGRTSMDPSGYAHPWSLLAGWHRLVARLVMVYVLSWGLLLAAAWFVRWSFAWLGSAAPAWAAGATLGNVLVGHLVWGSILGGPVLSFVGVRQFGLEVQVPALQLHRSRVRPWVWVTMDGWVPFVIEGRRGWERRYVRPVALAVDAVLGTHHPIRKAPKWVQVPRTYRNANGSPVVVQLPPAFTGADKGTMVRLEKAISARLGLRDPEVQWELEGDKPRVLVSSPPLPPSRVTFEDVRTSMESLPEYEILLGVAAKGKTLTAHLKGDSPHVAVSAGSGAGKSEMIKILIMLALRWGWGVVILDWKEVSQQWAEGLPGVTYVRDLADLHDACVRLGEEVDLRKAAHRKDPTMPGRANVLVVAEEMNVTAPLLSQYWSDLRSTADPEEKRTMPLKSPALTALQSVNFGGRQFRMFLVFVAQRFSSRVTNGNADLRESFQIRLIARCSTQTQKMLAGHIRPFPKMGVEQGRWCAVIGQDAVVYQAPLITREEAREFALGGVENPSSPLTSTYRLATPNDPRMDHELGESLGNRPTVPSQRQGALEGEVLPPVDARKLSEMTDGLSHLGVTLDVLRHASKDSTSGFPGVYGGSPNRGYTYDFQAVLDWARRRHAQRSAEREGR